MNRVEGRLKVNPDFALQIDYEMYEVIYLFIIVTDQNQEVNPDSADGMYGMEPVLKMKLTHTFRCSNGSHSG